MNSPRSGFHRATAASWALVGLGVAGVAGASSLAYADTFTPAAEAPVEVAVPVAPEDVGPPTDPDLPAAPDIVTTPVDPTPAPVAVPTEPTPTQIQTPVTTDAPVPQYTPQQTYEQAPAYDTRQTRVPAPTKTAPPTTRHVKPPTTVNSPNYSPHVTISRGS